MGTLKTVKILSFISLCLLVVGCTEKKKDENTAAAAPQKQLVKLQEVSVRSVEQLFEFTGNAEAFKTNNISPSMPVRIEKILVEVGDKVSVGQLVAKMDATQYVQQKAQLDNLQTDYKRTLNLYEAGGISKQELDKVKTSLDVMVSVVDNLSQNLELRSPISGVVTARNYDNGDMFGSQPIVTIQQLQPVKVLVNVSEEFFPTLKTNTPTKLKLDIYPDTTFDANVHLIYPTIDVNSHTFAVEVSIPNRDMLVRPGMFTRITFNFGAADRVVVPDQAIIKQQGSNERYVFVYENGKVRRKVIELGRRLGADYELLAGVENGDKVVVAGQTRLIDGSEVEVQN